MRRIALGAAWLLALAAGVALDGLVLRLLPNQSIFLPFHQGGLTLAQHVLLFTRSALEGIADTLPSALLLAMLVKGRRERLLIGAGWVAIALGMVAFNIPLGALLAPLQPQLSVVGGVAHSPPLSAYVPMLLVNAVVYYTVIGGLQALLLRRYLRLPVAWIALKVLGAILGVAIAVAMFSLDRASPLTHLSEIVYFVFGGAGMAWLWRWDGGLAELWRWRLTLPERAAPGEATAYGTWIADLESSLDKPKPT